LGFFLRNTTKIAMLAKVSGIMGVSEGNSGTEEDGVGAVVMFVGVSVGVRVGVEVSVGCCVDEGVNVGVRLAVVSGVGV
jgi:hypothetical protein